MSAFSRSLLSHNWWLILLSFVLFIYSFHSLTGIFFYLYPPMRINFQTLCSLLSFSLRLTFVLTSGSALFLTVNNFLSCCFLLACSLQDLFVCSVLFYLLPEIFLQYMLEQWEKNKKQFEGKRRWRVRENRNTNIAKNLFRDILFCFWVRLF